MYLENFIKKYNGKNLKIYVDMDGVISDYDVGNACDYDKKRPLKTSILKLKEISNLNNVELYILSITRKNEGIEQKNIWLDNNAPFFKKENRIIISKENNPGFKSKELKSNYLNSLKFDENHVIILIDDDPAILKEVRKNNPHIVLLKDSALVD